MPIITNNLSQQFTVSEIAKTIDVNTSTNIIKRREEIVYKTKLEPSSSNIALVTSQAISPDKNLSITDRSTSLLANRISQQGYTTLNTVDTFVANTDNILITDIFTAATNTVAALPLFYNHIINIDKLPRVDPDNENYTLESGLTLVSIELLDEDLQIIKTSELITDLNKGIIYNNLLSSYNTNEYNIYYVRYVVNDNGNVNTFTDLLDNIPIYRIANFEDLTEELTIIADGRKVYLIQELEDGFNVTLPAINTYAFQSVETARIQILPPTTNTITNSWFVRVSNGTFSTNIGGIVYKYYISEFLNQVFTPEPPVKQSLSEKSTILNTNLIKLNYDNIYQDPTLNLEVNILINDKDGNGVAAYTTDSNNINVIASNSQPYQKWNNIIQHGIRSIDHRSGIVDIQGIRLKSSYEVISTYSFKETNYEFTLVNFNPISNRKVLNTRTALFIDPDSILESSDQTLFFLTIDQAGKIIESNWSAFDNDLQQHISGNILYYEKLPNFLTTGIADIGKPNYVDPANITYFIDTFSVEGTQNGEFLILGDISVSEAFDANQITKFDARQRGGGIRENEYSNVVDTETEARWFWDEGYWDGIPYPGNASYMVEIPVTTLQGAGGVFPPRQVRDVINKHTAAGVYPVAKAYGVDITVTGIEPGPDNVTLLWHSEGF
jgi:hypothetical protein